MDSNLFKVFLWKNFLFLKFSWLSTTIINLACFIILYVFLKTTHNVVTAPNSNYEKQNTELLKERVPSNNEDFIFYGPSDNDYLYELMEKVRTDLYMSTERFKSFSNVSTMISALENNQKANCFGIFFEEWPDLNNKGSLRYSISSTMTKVSPSKRFVNDEDLNGIIPEDEYIRTGFLSLQHILDLNFIKSSTGTNAGLQIEISPLPSIGHESADGQRVNSFGLLFAVLFNVLLLSTNLIPLVEEKHDGIKEFLVLATPQNYLNGLTFFCVRFLAYMPFTLGCVVVAYTYGALGLIPAVYFIVLFVFYCSTAISYTFLISVCFKTVFYAKVGGFILLIIPFLFHLIDGKFSKVASYLFCTTTLLKGLNIFQVFTNKHRLFSGDDLFFNITESSPNVFTIMAILLLQFVVYTISYNYFSRIFPGKGGLKQPIFFFLNPSFYKKKNPNQFVSTLTETEGTAIIIQDLVKTFTSRNQVIRVADRLNMEIKERRITVLLGHNGAGKTTTLNMIIGCVPKDSGKIIVCSERDVTSYRHLIGFCPQHSVFMQYMTCYQHLRFFAQLRGKTVEEANSLASELLTQLRLVDKANESGKNLSGGMKRRLSLGIALSGETKVVILDEPSSGLDVESRRELWDILLELRKSKAVLITTHHMEEAEILGDTISILSNGKLEQTGTPLELKRKLGSGYILKLRTDGNFHEQSTLDIIKASVPTAKLINAVPPTVLISMPYAYKDKYTEVLEKLETNRGNLGINSLAVTDTSLEDVFLNSQGNDSVDSPCRNKGEVINIPYQKLLPDAVTWTRHVRAVFYKKFIFVKSQLIYSAIMFSLPFLAIGIAVFIMTSLASNKSDGNMHLNLKHLKDGYIFINVATEFKAIENNIKQEIQSKGIEVKYIQNPDAIEEELKSIQSTNLYEFYEKAIGAIVVKNNENNPEFSILYSANIIHSSVIMVNLIDNAILKHVGNSNESINTTYSPIRRIIDINPTSLEYFAAIVPIGFFFYMLYYISLPYIENKSNFKSLQAIPRPTYWVSFVVFDMLLHSLVCTGCYFFQQAVMPKTLYSSSDQTELTFTYLFYGFSYLPIIYCMTIGFRSISPISTYLLFMLIISSIVPFITSDNVQSMQHFDTTISIMSLLPDFSLNHQLRAINEHFFANRRKAGSRIELPSLSRFFSYAVVLYIFVMLFLIYVWDNLQRRQYLKEVIMCYRFKRTGQLNQPLEDVDEALVRKEKGNVEEIFRSNTKDSYPLIVQNLHKFYGRIHAVRGINFAVKRQECFGLLGVNGAGKTSTFQMITANSLISGGHIMIDGIDLTKSETLYKYRFGYCPQGDCLNSFMTSYQILKYMAMLRNISSSDLGTEVMYWLAQLDLTRYKNVPIRFYSGGTKRKLNAAIAMIGNPTLVLLDEPTTGVDPISRRFLWKCIKDFQNRDKTVVLTSHSMDECEHLCNRLAIMANGKLQCIGFIPDLKSKYGSGFTINIKLLSNWSDNKINIITSSLQEEFTCELREQHAGMLTYFIKEKSMEWSEIFRRTERFMSCNKSLVEDYSVNETTLEDIFLKFDKKSRGAMSELTDDC
ncbi:ATP-binding cassette sub-family A member 17 [Eupeodes corollae]|uniref:ATP-binding cassette sub-family A member 17 n=1 Tax=Eupeodes corollae TaxID=290404 RepID=UPI00248F8723|nr:ATP-binding cassette sub-family A member 17 [Eupeodes corollae]